MFSKKLVVFALVIALLVLIATLIATVPHVPAHAYAHNPIVSHRIMVDLHTKGKATADLEARSWTMNVTCAGEGQVGVLVHDNQDQGMPVQKANCDGKTHTLGTYSSTGLFTFNVVSHATTLHFIVTENMLY